MYRLIEAARCHEWLADARVHTRDLSRVERGGEKVKVAVVRFHDIGVRERKGKELVVFRSTDELLLGVRERQMADLDGVAVDAKHLGPLVQVLLV